MTAGSHSGQHWMDCDDDIHTFVMRLSATCQMELGASFRACYLHGSLAVGAFRRHVSDLDILLVTSTLLGPEARADLATLLTDLSDRRPLPGGIEVSVVHDAHLNPFTHPTPYQLHLSARSPCILRPGDCDHSAQRVDRDLAAHCQVLRTRGIVLAGPPIHTVIGPVPSDDYIDALLYDLADILEDSHLLASPVYGILNACRILATLRNGNRNPLNKEEGAIWGLAHMPRAQRLLVGQALESRRGRWPISPEHMLTGGLRWDKQALEDFRDYVASEVARLMGSTIAG